MNRVIVFLSTSVEKTCAVTSIQVWSSNPELEVSVTSNADQVDNEVNHGGLERFTLVWGEQR